MYLRMECNKCRVSKFCGKKGISPTRLNNGINIYCRLVGGYGRIPVDKEILSEDSKTIVSKNGRCLTIAEVPEVVGNDFIFHVEKIFHPPVKHEREISNNMAHMVNDTNMKNIK